MKKVIIIGAGLAGSQAAYYLQQACQVVIYTKRKRENCNSMLAQGGIAAAIDPGDTWQSHYDDTLKAGVQHNDPTATKVLVQDGITDMQALIQNGMKFDRDAAGHFEYGLEGAHARPRILHCHGDQTGKYVTLFMHQQLQQVTWREDCMVTALLKTASGCVGIQYLDPQGHLQMDTADAVVLAAGGLGRIYPLTTNDITVTGDGMALARRAGVALADMEFVQFHPTLLTIKGKCYGLISEAVRGAGGYLIDENRHRLMAAYPQQDLSPRDVVARVLTQAYQAGHQVFLSIEKIPNFETRFPQITANLDAHQVPFRENQLIPVRPGAHFMMGGVKTDTNGATSMPHLYAVGETACTGVHGANRLASNSLLECLVYGKRVAAAILAAPTTPLAPVPTTPVTTTFRLPERTQLQAKAWALLGIQRSGAGLKDFLAWLQHYQYWQLPADYTAEAVEQANLCLAAEAIAQAALKRPKSLGAHARKDA